MSGWAAGTWCTFAWRRSSANSDGGEIRVQTDGDGGGSDDEKHGVEGEGRAACGQRREVRTTWEAFGGRRRTDLAARGRVGEAGGT